MYVATHAKTITRRLQGRELGVAVAGQWQNDWSHALFKENMAVIIAGY